MLSLNHHHLPEQESTISPLSDSFMYGYGVFETLRTYNRVIFKLDEHIKRLFHSAEILKLKHEYSFDSIKKETERTFAASGQKEARIKIVLTQTELLVWIQELTLRPSEWYETGIKIVTYQAERFMPEAKHLNCLPSYMAQLYAKEQGVYEALLIDNNNYVREGSYSNIFWIKDEVLYTTKNKVLRGITADLVLEIAKDIMQSELKDIELTELFAADECFITNTTSEILPVVGVDGREIRRGGRTSELRKVFREMVQNF